MFSCLRKSHGSRRTKGKGGLLGRLWGRLACLVTYLCSSRNMEDQGQTELDLLFKPLKFDYQRPDFIKKVVKYLPTAVRKGKQDFVFTFLAVYPAFATTWQVLEMIANMILYASSHAFFLDGYNTNSNLLLFLALWMQEMPQDFRMSPDRVLLRKLVDYLYQNLPFTFYQLHVQKLMEQLEAQVFTETLEEEAEAGDCGFSSATTPVAPVLDTTEMQEMPLCRPPSVTGPWGDFKIKKDTKNSDLVEWGRTRPEAGPVQPRRTSPDRADVGIDIQHVRHIPAVVPVVPLPDADV